MRNRTVMVVEDNDAIREALADLLSDEGYRVLAARNGQEALALLSTAPPSVILLDIAMPVMNGVEFCAQLGQVAGRAAIPVVVVTASRHSPDAYGLQVDAWLQKPFDIGELFTLVRGYAGGSRASVPPGPASAGA